MFYQKLLADVNPLKVTYSAIGMSGEYGASLLAYSKNSDILVPQVLCDLKLEKLQEILAQCGYTENDWREVYSLGEAITTVDDGLICITNKQEVALELKSAVVVEATGDPILGVDIAHTALRRGSNVVMVNKEADIIGGASLVEAANEFGLNYVYAHGDQPRNLIELIAWARLVGLEIVAAGKSSEYDFIYDDKRNEITHLDKTIHVPDFKSVWDVADPVGALPAREEMLDGFPLYTAPDYGEMALVSNSTGLLPSIPEFHYPLARISELADIYAMRQDGGVIDNCESL